MKDTNNTKSKSWLSRLFSEAGFRFLDVSIRTKILGLVLVCIIFSSASLIWYTDRDARHALRMSSEEAGTSLVRALVEWSRPLLAAGNIEQLNTTLSECAAANQDISYIFILDQNRDVVASFSTGLVSGSPAGIGGVSIGPEPTKSEFKMGKHEFTDIALPIGNVGGSVHVGLVFDSVQHTVATHITHIMFWLVAVLFVAVFLAYILSRAMTQPIFLLATEARELGRGAYRRLNHRWGHNEIGVLGSAFDEMSREIQRKEEMRSRLVAQVLSAQEEERKRIARELHDDTSQNLTSLLVELKAAENIAEGADIKKKLADLRELAHKTLADVHGIAVELRPNVLDDLGLNAALEKYVAEYQAKTGIKVDLHIAPSARRRWSPEIETAAYRIAQEALANVTRHAKAKNVSVVVSYQNRRLSLIIEDDGAGFNLTEALKKGPEHRLGLFGMDERAALIGGKLVVESAPGQGTSVFLEVPIKESYGENKDSDS